MKRHIPRAFRVADNLLAYDTFLFDLSRRSRGRRGAWLPLCGRRGRLGLPTVFGDHRFFLDFKLNLWPTKAMRVVIYREGGKNSLQASFLGNPTSTKVFGKMLRFT